ncbi:acyl-CoA thioester hydrolase YciA [Gallaecimonas pentaromativorans]|uniref:Acyl-CoA thioesterase YciA n=1 Tax=Gallaecimonas pentaromativorans TaxID=584787 RepID=A0A3N1PDY8_9GAMM|nr:acyl-CoA thioester hydrolase YciA [Gallaecimonas pentaromativorans]MED5525759.1 acyl-CoA thioester hydrolase YciA [Pseudomonadota bacterium]ROQ25010.1 acyl-CoA thioesterase YciA [Gallaecimonas pentaromativorans]
MTDAKRHPSGDLIIRTQTMPADTNQNGDIFGGWIMSQMDLGGGMLATEIAKGRIATVAVEGMTFHQPVKVGDVVCVYGECTRIGRTSMTIKLEVWIKPLLRDENAGRYCVTEATYTYVAIDDAGRPRPVPKD